MPTGPDGKASFNLFGVKAGARWDGAAVGAKTTEFENDLPVARVERFRAYDSVQAGVDAVGAERLVYECLRVDGDVLRVGPERISLAGVRRILGGGARKAGGGMPAGGGWLWPTTPQRPPRCRCASRNSSSRSAATMRMGVCGA